MIKQTILGVVMSFMSCTVAAQGAELGIEELRTKMLETSEYVGQTALGAMMLIGKDGVCQLYYKEMEAHRKLETATEDELRSLLPMMLDAKASADEVHESVGEEPIQAAFAKVIERCTL